MNYINKLIIDVNKYAYSSKIIIIGYLIILLTYLISSIIYFRKTSSISLLDKMNILNKYSKENYIPEILFMRMFIILIFLYPIIFLFIKDYLYLNDSLIFNLWKTNMHNVYNSIISVIMVFSIDIASVQFLNDNVDNNFINNENRNLYYLNINKLDFLSNFYLIIHQFIRKYIFYIILFLFTVLPLIIFNKCFKNNYICLAKLLLAIWQTLFVIVIILLIVLIMSDFSSYKNINFLKKYNNKVEYGINRKYYYNMIQLLSHDICKNDRSFYKYINKLMNNNMINRRMYMYLSINVFIYHLLDIHIFHFLKTYDTASLWSLIKKYLSLLNNNQALLNNKIIINFMNVTTGYLYLLNNIYENSRKNFVDLFINVNHFGLHTITTNKIIPDFVFRETDDADYWDIINGMFCNNDLIDEMLGYQSEKKCNDISSFNYENKYYNDKCLNFIQDTLKKFINHELYIMNNRCKRNQGFMDMFLAMNRYFNNFFQGYSQSEEFKLNIKSQLSPQLILFLKKRFPNLKN